MAANDFLIQNDDKDPVKLQISNDPEANLISFSDHHLVIETESTHSIPTQVEVEIQHSQLDEPIAVGAQLLEEAGKPAGSTSVNRFRVELSQVSENIKNIWMKFFTQRLRELKAKDIMTKDPLCCLTTDLVKDAVGKINAAGVGSIAVVSDSGALQGIFTERDILKHSMDEGLSSMPVSELMTASPQTIQPEASAHDIYLKFRGSRFRHLPVVEGDKLTGMISLRDLVRYWTSLLEHQRQEISNKYEKAMSVIVHDLRSPIYAIRSINELVMDGLEEPASWKEAEFPTMINESCKTMIALIDDLLDISELKSGHIRLTKQPVDFKELIEKTVEVFRPSATAKEISLNLSLAESGQLELDRRKMTQVLQNVISNAIKYTDKKGKVDIELQKTSKGMSLGVSDYGQGIQPEELHKVFDELCKISSTPTGDEASTGLGLSITKKIVEAHGGSISAESDPGVKTTFTINI